MTETDREYLVGGITAHSRPQFNCSSFQFIQREVGSAIRITRRGQRSEVTNILNNILQHTTTYYHPKPSRLPTILAGWSPTPVPGLMPELGKRVGVWGRRSNPGLKLRTTVALHRFIALSLTRRPVVGNGHVPEKQENGEEMPNNDEELFMAASH